MLIFPRASYLENCSYTLGLPFPNKRLSLFWIQFRRFRWFWLVWKITRRFCQKKKSGETWFCTIGNKIRTEALKMQTKSAIHLTIKSSYIEKLCKPTIRKHSWKKCHFFRSSESRINRHCTPVHIANWEIADILVTQIWATLGPLNERCVFPRGRRVDLC